MLTEHLDNSIILNKYNILNCFHKIEAYRPHDFDNAQISDCFEMYSSELKKEKLNGNNIQGQFSNCSNKNFQNYLTVQDFYLDTLYGVVVFFLMF